jgi:alanine racemase
VKANAYGHGAEVCAPVLAQAGAEWLGVADAEEGAAVRAALKAIRETEPRILVMCGPLEKDAEATVRHRLTPVVWNQQQMEWLAAAVLQQGGEAAPLPVHLEIDTGMARQGLPPGEALHTLLHWLKRQPHLRLEGVMTHFASPEIAGSPLTAVQRQRFEEAIAAVEDASLRPAWIHAGNSSVVDTCSVVDTRSVVDTCSAADNLDWLHLLAQSVGARAMVRAGIALYGYCLPIEQAHSSDQAIQARVQPGLQPVMTWKTRVIGLHEIKPGDTVGYNAIFKAERTMRLALLAVGYADGLRRELSGSTSHAGGWVMLHGQRAAIVGRISMNLTVVDVTNIPRVVVGDEVIVLGDGITADDHARIAHTIPYEIVCGVRPVSHLVA